MTDNEKAATFIGWKPSTLCPTEQNRWADNECGHGIRGEHDVPAPDMSDPRNYMKALEACGATSFRFLQDEQPDMSGYKRFATYIQHRAMGKLITHKGWRLGLGNSARDALAALYDAENPNS